MTTTKNQREALYQKAADLLRRGLGSRQAEVQLTKNEGVSIERARHAVATVLRRQRKPKKGGN